MKYLIVITLLMCCVGPIAAQDIISTESIHKFNQQKMIPTRTGPARENPTYRKSIFHNENGQLIKSRKKNSTIQVNYVGFNAQAQAAFQYAVDIWEGYINSDVPINIEARWVANGWDPDPAASNNLGFAGPNGGFQLLRSTANGNAIYPQALAEKIVAYDLNQGGIDILASFNSDVPIWHLDPNSPPSSSQVDFVSTVLHEIGHGLGFFGIGPNGDIYGGTSILPSIYASFVEKGDGTKLTSYAAGDPQLLAAITGNDIYFNGPITVNNNNGNRVKLYGPNPFEGGSSFVHLDHIPASPLMEPTLDKGEVKHSLTDFELGMLYDLGYGPEIGVSIPINSCTSETSPINLSDYLVCADLTATWSVNSNGLMPTSGFNPIGQFTPIGNQPGIYIFDMELPLGILNPVTVELIDLNSGTATNPPSEVCLNSTTPINLYNEISGEMTGGTWSVNASGSQPSGGFNSAAGVFTPSNNGPGTYMFDYTIAGQAVPGSPALSCSQTIMETDGNLFGNATVTASAIFVPPNCMPDARAKECADVILTLDVTAYDNGTPDRMNISIRPNNCSNPVPDFAYSGVGTYIFYSEMLNPLIDPSEGFCVIVYDGDAQATNIDFTLNLSIEYPEIPDTGCEEQTSTATIVLTDCAPVAICQATAIAEIDAAGNLVLDPASLNNGSTDDNTSSGDLIFSIDFGGIVLDCDDVGMPAQTVSLIVTDNLAQTSSCTSQITVEDNIAPTADCSNIAVDLDVNGEYFISDSDVFNRMTQNWMDNCAIAPVNFGSNRRLLTCDDIGVYVYFFGVRDGNGQETTCTAQIQVNDPLGLCDPGTLDANCTSLTAEPDMNGNFILDANSMDNGSIADLGLYTLVFSDDTDLQGSLTNDCTFSNAGQGMAFTAGITGSIQTIRVDAVSANSTTLHLYEGDNGSGILGSVGTPAYSQPVELFANPGGSLTNILLNIPFPVVAGQRYSFLLEGSNTLRYACSGSPSYIGGRAIEDYVGFFQFDQQSYAFEVDIIGPTTQEFTAEGNYPVDLYAVDDQGNVSPACNATFTLESSCVADRQEDDNPIISDLYEAYNSISSSGIVSAGAVDFSAKTFIELQAGFEVINGNEFHAFIEGCDGAPFLSNTESRK